MYTGVHLCVCSFGWCTTLLAFLGLAWCDSGKHVGVHAADALLLILSLYLQADQVDMRMAHSLSVRVCHLLCVVAADDCGRQLYLHCRYVQRVSIVKEQHGMNAAGRWVSVPASVLSQSSVSYLEPEIACVCTACSAMFSPELVECLRAGWLAAHARVLQ
jgi:hypothetical protein